MIPSKNRGGRETGNHALSPAKPRLRKAKAHYSQRARIQRMSGDVPPALAFNRLRYNVCGLCHDFSQSARQTT